MFLLEADKTSLRGSSLQYTRIQRPQGVEAQAVTICPNHQAGCGEEGRASVTCT